MKHIHNEELEDGDKERPSAFPKITLKQTDSGMQQLHGAGERAQDQRSQARNFPNRCKRAVEQEMALSMATSVPFCAGSSSGSMSP
jgi:hypothetical protein